MALQREALVDRMDKKVVGYCRVSTLEQRKKGFGIDIQIRDIKKFCEINEIKIDNIYKDKAQSGAEEDRKALNQLIGDCEAGKIASIIIPSLDRLSRDVRIAENLFYLFDRLNVKVFIADMPFYDGNNRRDVFIRQIREAIAEENRKEIVERLLKGRKERVLQGKPPGGTLPYGYSRNHNGYEINQLEAKLVRFIFRLQEQGKKCKDIVDALNYEGLRRRNGKPWTERQVRSILAREELYRKGILKYGDAKGRDEGLVIL